MEVDEREKVQQWAARAEVSKYLPKLFKEAFNTMQKICTIKMENLVAMGITKISDQNLILEAVEEAREAALMAKRGPGTCAKFFRPCSNELERTSVNITVDPALGSPN
jgi:hypothetical protein